MRYYQKSTAHLTFKFLELIECINNIIAKNYPVILGQ
ncbi:DUF4942 domain-containing protein [Zymobacter sp. IVIA_5232.4 C2]